ncbi:hypothetical protein DFH29DRAFT_996849 [Suillus ampliporus]|nr:hypothetical protein DFH29DRAFT_996849 [Suillus ampliporus]
MACLKRVAVPSVKVICADNAADRELASHSITSPTSSRSHKVTIVEVDDNDNDIELTGSTHKKRLMKGKKRAYSPDPPECVNETEHDASPSTVNALHATSSANQSDEVDADGFLKDVQVVSINEASENPHQEQRSRDITKFFSEPYTDKGKKHRNC